MFNLITKKEYNKIKNILKEVVPYSIYKEYKNIYEINKEILLETVFFSYLFYLSEKEYNSLKEKIEKILNKRIDIKYTSIPLFNEEQENKEKTTITVLKPKIEHEVLDKKEILKLIEEQNKKKKEISPRI